MATQYMPLPAQYDLNEDWTVYESRLKQFFLAYEIVDAKRKAAIVLTSLSNEAFKVLTNLFFPDGSQNF